MDRWMEEGGMGREWKSRVWICSWLGVVDTKGEEYEWDVR